jgi:hypothetical protein
LTFNVVNVTVEADPSPVDAAPAEGNVVAAPDGVQWPDTNNNPIVPMVVTGYLNDGQNGAGANETIIQLVASDNFAAGVLTWDFIINIRSLPTVNVQGCVVDYSNGATQSVWAILSAAGWQG